MNRRRFITCSLGVAGLGVLGWKFENSSKIPLKKVTRSSRALGTQVHITLHAETHSQGEDAIDAALAAIEHVESVMSLYRPDSQLSQLNHVGVLENPAAELIEVLRISTNLSCQTEGAFDITVQPLWELYSRHAHQGKLPSSIEIEIASEKIDWRKVIIEPFGIQLNDGAQITLNGIAQGFAADAARAALQAHGIEHAILDTGELSAFGENQQRDHWSVGIKHPRESGFLGIAELNGRCLATSGDYETSFSRDLKAHHLFDPKTGACANACTSVSVVADTATQADSLSTACFVLGVKRGMELIENTAGVDALFMAGNGSITRSANFPIKLL